ncbi:FUSC family protein [Cohnella algarum]|uniref:FUSC family protein n=1 Tax=Cohnella algarum TaxID=2044859 RepID=UPI001968475B|nr:aromatic acid exporter family protein [Cohnella algarum]MBN2981989.1 FUSC family protein [Cohnella algarum]
MTIGARVFKTGLAVAVALWLGTLAGLESPVIAAVAAIFTVQPSIYRSWMQVLDQLQSNVLGAGIAIAAYWLFGSAPLSVGLVCILVILLCIKLKTEDTIGLTLVTVVIIMEAQNQGWPAALDRLVSLLLGIGCAFAVNVSVAPPKHHSRFVRQVQEAQNQLSRLLRTSVSNELKENVFRKEQEQLHEQLRKLDDFYRLFAEERVLKKRSRLRKARLLVMYKEMMMTLERGYELIEAVEEQYFAVPSDPAWNRMVDQHIEMLCGYHEQLLWKWDKKLKAGAVPAAPPPESGVRLTEMIAAEGEFDDALKARIAAQGETEVTVRARLLVVTSALFAYEDRLHRLDKLMDHWFERGLDGAEE